MGAEFRAGRGGASFPVGNAVFPGHEGLDGVAVLTALTFSPIDSTNRRWANGGGYHTTAVTLDFARPARPDSRSPTLEPP